MILSRQAPASGPGAVRPLLCLLLGALLVLDALFLLAERVFSLGVTLPLALGLALLLLGMRWTWVQAWLEDAPHRRALWKGLWLAFALWLISVLAFWSVLASAGQAPANASPAPAAILVLGSGTPGAKVSPTLAARLDAGLVQARLYPGAVVVVSGGVDLYESVSEGQVMGDYLRAAGLDAGRIVQEERSSSTHENLVLSKPLLQRHGIQAAQPIQLVTSDFHTLRAGWIAERAGYARITTIGAPTPLYIRYNAWLREYFAVASGWLLREFG
ncbi:YdcF family protein [Ramlibacter tataouinensis]|uniref:YdcF family protein n=1 Tax=Ramlibacter tataouinensis TaxID=94132 RepID=UPI00077808A9|nr:YdcF family protein [Ramlibacter tataouinensis]